MADSLADLLLDYFEKGLSPGIKSGRILATQTQYDRWLPEHQKLFEPVYLSETVLYRYRHAKSEHVGYSPLDLTKADPNDMHDRFRILVDAFCNELAQPYNLKQVEADEDEEFSYHAFLTAIATLGMSEEDWLFEKLYGNMYIIRNIEQELNATLISE